MNSQSGGSKTARKYTCRGSVTSGYWLVAMAGFPVGRNSYFSYFLAKFLLLSYFLLLFLLFDEIPTFTKFSNEDHNYFK